LSGELAFGQWRACAARDRSNRPAGDRCDCRHRRGGAIRPAL